MSKTGNMIISMNEEQIRIISVDIFLTLENPQQIRRTSMKAAATSSSIYSRTLLYIALAGGWGRVM